MRSSNWYVITGGPGSGKTSLISMLADMGYVTVPEAARTIINEGLARSETLEQIRGDEQAWQSKILRRILDNEARTNPYILTFFDRGAHDGLAHLRYYGHEPPHEWQTLAGAKPYHTVFLLEPLPDFENDYARTENADFTDKITGMMADAYAEHEMEPVRIPYGTPEERLKQILLHLQADGYFI